MLDSKKLMHTGSSSSQLQNIMTLTPTDDHNKPITAKHERQRIRNIH
jgi:hypothetical protein